MSSVQSVSSQADRPLLPECFTARTVMVSPRGTRFVRRRRDVSQGPDGLLYVVTEEDDAALLRIEPVE